MAINYSSSNSPDAVAVVAFQIVRRAAVITHGKPPTIGPALERLEIAVDGRLGVMDYYNLKNLQGREATERIKATVKKTVALSHLSSIF